jgi:hypothetical protein
MKKILKWTIVGTFLAVITVGGFCLWILFGSKTSNPNNYKTIGEIPEPWGYERINGDDVAYTNYLRSLPLKERGAKVQLYTRGRSACLCALIMEKRFADKSMPEYPQET